MSSVQTSPSVFFRLSSQSPKVQKALEMWEQKLSPKQRTWISIGFVAFVILASFATYRMMWFESTDDSFVKARVHVVSARISGTVTEILVKENQKVKKGDVLLKLDSRDYEVAIKAAQANYSKAHKDLGRFKGYLDQLGPTDRPVFDQYQASALVTEAELTKAQLQYEYTSVVAAEDGTVGKRSVETGEQIQAGQALMPLVEPEPWIEANFKENQVAHIRPGQEVHIKVDSIPEQSFEGHVESIAPGSGSTFSLLPPDNATGNFTKIVQRIPVKIVFDKKSIKGFEDRLITGMSTEVRVKVR
ncbi:HlyD family secretion protein [Bdellovibrio sp. HCB2-146]|uniref:HlyD family secretion protein n=1 Tax=Bdellovibrio sp. HCB2-146 TaxID=3394362 RepID=UPI0039BC6D39